MRSLALIWLAFLLLCSCGKPEQRAVPRMQGYARVAEYPAQYKLVRELPIRLYANDQAKVIVERGDDGSFWATVFYPRFNAKLYYTFTSLANRDANALVENRLERMRLDLGNSTDIRTEEYLNPQGISIWTLYAPNVLTTPIKFLALDKNWMVSGSAFLENAHNPDSVAPIIENLLRDTRYSLLNLAP